MENVDLLICGAGPVGCTIANRAANLLGWKVLIVEKRNHLAGNCFDEHHDSGVLIHRYGPHYFRTNNLELLDFLSKYTEWIPGNYIVKSFSRGEYFPFPINLLTLEQFFHRSFTPESAQKFLEEIAEPIANPKNSEEFVLVRFNKDCRYVDHKFQVTPKAGFTAMFKRMVDHPNISVLLQSDFKQVARNIKPRHATVYSGPIDEYFDCRLGKLPWRSLHFDFKEYPVPFRQPCVQINYPNDFDYTRTVEIKHVTQQQSPNTVISYEYSRAEGDPYYPIPAAENEALYRRYAELAKAEEQKGVYFVGRLAAYRYYNTDQVLEEALKAFESIKERAAI